MKIYINVIVVITIERRRDAMIIILLWIIINPVRRRASYHIVSRAAARRAPRWFTSVRGAWYSDVTTSVAVCRVTRTPAPLRRPVAFRLNIIIFRIVQHTHTDLLSFRFLHNTSCREAGRIPSSKYLPTIPTFYDIIIIFVFFPAGR